MNAKKIDIQALIKAEVQKALSKESEETPPVPSYLPELSWEFITIEKARAIVENAKTQRRLRPAKIDAYKRDFLRGKWVEGVPDPICEGEDGSNLNGNHRLTALIAASEEDSGIKGAYFLFARGV